MIHRALNLLKKLEGSRSALLFGPRGVGKTQLVKEYLRSFTHSLYIDLLRSENYRRYLLDPGQYRKDVIGAVRTRKSQTDLSSNPPLVVVVDEVQRVPEILDETHALIEEFKGEISFILTGSSARKLKRGGANLLGGRAITLRLHPFSFLELAFDLDRALTVGTLPAIHLDPGDVTPLLTAYVDTYLREEVLQESIIRKVDPFLRFMDVVGQTNGEPVTFSNIAKQAGVSPHTVQNYYQILEDTLLGRLIPAFDRSVRRQLTQSPKFFLFDCGVVNTLRGDLGAELRPSSYRYGKLFETLVVNEIIRANDYLSSDLRLSHWRTSRGLEVDLVITTPHNSPLFGVEIKAGPTPDRGDLKGLNAFHEEFPEATCVILCTTPHPYRLDFVEVLPWTIGIERLARWRTTAQS